MNLMTTISVSRDTVKETTFSMSLNLLPASIGRAVAFTWPRVAEAGARKQESEAASDTT